MALLTETRRDARTDGPIRVMPSGWQPTEQDLQHHDRVEFPIVLGLVCLVVLVAAVVTQDWWGLLVIPIAAVAAAMRTRTPHR